MIRPIIAGLLLAATPAAPAWAEPLQPGRIEPFDVRPADGKSLAWLERWLAENQPDDPGAYDQAMSFALSASERRQTRDTMAGANRDISTSTAYMLAQSHLGKIHYMAEVRWNAGLTNVTVPGIDDPARPRWQTRHLCAGVLMAEDWVLTAAHCVSPVKLAAGIEAALGTSDLARDGGLTRPVDRIVVHIGAGLALLHLGGTAQGYSERGIAPAQRAVSEPPEPDQYAPLLSYSALGWGSHINSAGLAIAPWRYSVVMGLRAPECGLPEDIQPAFCLTNKALKFCRQDSGGPVYRNAEGQGAGLFGIVSWDRPECFRPPVSEDQLAPPAPIIALEPYRDWLTRAMAAPKGMGQDQGIP